MGNEIGCGACDSRMIPRYQIDGLIFEEKVNPTILRQIKRFQLENESIDVALLSTFKNTCGRYRGNVVNDQRHGLGIQEFEKSNEIYFGQFKNDIIEGSGFFINFNETIYYGNWKNNVPTGLGLVFTKENATIVCSQWNQGNMTGKVLQISDEYTYHGEIKYGPQDGLGVCYWKNGQIHKGYWDAGKYDGFGSLVSRDGETYEGDFNQNMMSGQGKLTEKNSDTYYGQFKTDRKHGYGILIQGDEFTQGIWDNGLLLTSILAGDLGQQYAEDKQYKIACIPEEWRFPMDKVEQYVQLNQSSQFLQEGQEFQKYADQAKNYIITQQLNFVE